MHVASLPAATAAENVPIGQLMHASGEVSPVVALEYFPAVHDVQIVIPSAVEYLPAGHFWQVAEVAAPAVAENLPASHGMHVAEDVALVALEYFPAEHWVHVCVAAASAYVPGAHCWHMLKLEAPVD